tara:strand:+ start:78 stop:527 length:450 start_codon:yes stop_codon:yes gene_type:complete
MTDKNNKFLIDYNLHTIDAMRDVVKKVLKNIINNTLPGNHHFYITFDTNFKNVEIPNSLKKKHPEEMTIVIENSFWDLIIKDSYFSITLSFNNIKSKLTIPYKSLLVFSDPFASFHLKFPKLEYNKEVITKIEENKKNIINIKDFKKDK